MTDASFDFFFGGGSWKQRCWFLYWIPPLGPRPLGGFLQHVAPTSIFYFFLILLILCQSSFSATQNPKPFRTNMKSGLQVEILPLVTASFSYEAIAGSRSVIPRCFFCLFLKSHPERCLMRPSWSRSFCPSDDTLHIFVRRFSTCLYLPINLVVCFPECLFLTSTHRSTLEDVRSHGSCTSLHTIHSDKNQIYVVSFESRIFKKKKKVIPFILENLILMSLTPWTCCCFVIVGSSNLTLLVSLCHVAFYSSTLDWMIA